MKALNNKERNSALLKFSLWLVICVLIVSAPIAFTAFVPGEQQSVKDKENEKLIKEINFEKEYFAVQIKNIMDLMNKTKANEISVDAFNAQLYNIIEDIKKQTEKELNWRGDMYRNVLAIAGYLVEANKSIDAAKEIFEGGKNEKGKLKSNLNKVIVEFENCGDDISNMKSKRRGDCKEAASAVDKEFKKALKLLKECSSEL